MIFVVLFGGLVGFVFLWLVCKLTTYTDIGKMGLANLFFVPPP